MGARLTSARAERTGSVTAATGSTPAHLRSRGEDPRSRRSATGRCGSPPLARRGRDPARPRRPQVRLTSARAERTCRSARAAPGRPAHLRSRGEDTASPSPCVWAAGSPPLARRGLTVLSDRLSRARLTSARAERTYQNPGVCSLGPAHLRSRGEDLRSFIPKVYARGSPPLARRGPFLTWVSSGGLQSLCHDPWSPCLCPSLTAR